MMAWTSKGWTVPKSACDGASEAQVAEGNDQWFQNGSASGHSGLVHDISNQTMRPGVAII